MDEKCRAIRTVLGRSAKEKAVAYIDSFQLNPDERACLIDREVRRKSVQQIAMEQNVSPETVKRWRKNALRRMAAELNI